MLESLGVDFDIVRPDELGARNRAATANKISRKISENTASGIYSLIVFGSKLPKELDPEKTERIEMRRRYDGDYVHPTLESMQKDLTGGRYVALSAAELTVYNLMAVTNKDTLGFPGVWLLYGDSSFFIKPIPILTHCLSCEPLMDKLSGRSNDMDMAAENIIDRTSAGHRPYACPGFRKEYRNGLEKCMLFEAQNKEAGVYKDRHYAVESGVTRLLLRTSPVGQLYIKPAIL